MKRTFGTFSLAIGAALSLAAGDLDLMLVPPRPVRGAATYSPVAGGFNATPAYSLDVTGAKLHKSGAVSAGMIASEMCDSSHIGDFLQPPADFAVDWAKTQEEFEKSVAGTNGFLLYTGLQDSSRRYLTTRTGSFEFTWYGKDGATSNTVHYNSFPVKTVVPHRLFWTSAPFNGPGVAIPKNYGVKLCGDASLFQKEDAINANGAVTYDNGVRYDKSSGTVNAYAHLNENGEWDGPRGSLVVAYYDSPAFETFLGYTVVEVTSEDRVYLSAKVGSELCPQNENYDVTTGRYLPVIQNGQDATTEDPRAPYVFYQKKVAGQYHAKENRVFAISETESGAEGAKKAEIYWEAADDFNVYWPFEQTCYHITWPECPTVVVGDGGVKGPGVTVPSSYSVSALDWREPSSVVTVDSTTGEVTVNGAGRFALKLENEARDDFWFVPLRSALNSDEESFPIDGTCDWPLGFEVLPQVIRAGEADSRLGELVASVDRDVPGYIYEPNSSGRNWNPNLYHAEGASAAASTGDAAYAGLVSTIWFVNLTAARTDAEVWWQRSYREGGMPEAITFPVLPQRYKAVDPEVGMLQDVVFSSLRGSAAGGRCASRQSLLLRSGDACGSLEYGYRPGVDASTTLQFWLNAAPLAAEPYGIPATAGRVMSLEVGDRKVVVDIVRPCTKDAPGGMRLSMEGAPYGIELPTAYNRWSAVSMVVSPTHAKVYVDDDLLTNVTLTVQVTAVSTNCLVTVGSEGGGAAAGTAVDGVTVWNYALTEEELLAGATNDCSAIFSRATVAIDFTEATRAADGTAFAKDQKSYACFAGTGFAFVTPGRPEWTDGVLREDGGFAPRIYYQNDRSACGYNPNEEHAVMLETADGGQAVWALRNDMNDDNNKPYLFAEYAEEGRGKMRAFRFLCESRHYRWPERSMTAGYKVTTLPPLDRMPSGTCPATTTRPIAVGAESVVYRDRLNGLWARRDGSFNEFVYYYGEDGFVCTAGTRADLAGDVLPIMDKANAYVWESERADGYQSSRMARTEYSRDKLVSFLAPGPIFVTSRWPSVPPNTMSVAQVLTGSENGLAGVYDMSTCAVTYPTAITPEQRKSRVVKLIDPTRARTRAIPLVSDFPAEYGFTVGERGDCYLKGGKYYFTGLPPVVSDRLYVDINAGSAGTAMLTFVGDMQDDGAGTSYLRVNSLNAATRDGILRVFGEKAGARTQQLVDAVNAIYGEEDVEPSVQLQTSGEGEPLEIGIDYAAADHYALVATGEGSGWVTYIENDGEAAGSNAPQMHSLYVSDSLYCGKLVTLIDANNTLSEQLSILYTAPLGRAADGFFFEWWHTDAPSDGHTPNVPPVAGKAPSDADYAWKSADKSRSGDGCNVVEAVDPASASLNELVNRYWTMRYRAKDGSPAFGLLGDKWSVCCDATLAEGWVQRVLNAVTPFSQRLADYSKYAVDTSVTMPSQIGEPWRGDVALNNDNLANVGLMELYRTILNKAESMSIARGECSDTTAADVSSAANKQLLMAAARLVDFDLVLGNEAYADAKNPLIGSEEGLLFPGGVFSFANQLPTLLDEELALLRGRTSELSPSAKTFPCYNRLLWNYTKGMTQGEVAYVNNYGILSKDGLNTAKTAAEMYPQGHGDAYGYYLSAVTEFYRLLRNPNFTWGTPAMMEMLVSQNIVNVDYEEEDKFAEASYRLAKTGADVVDLTARKQWRDNAADIRSGYFDDADAVVRSDGVRTRQAFGYGQFACRTGFGALCNWAVANALLPTNAATATRFTDRSISCVTRQTCSSLRPLADILETVENAVNEVDAGLNPIGLSQNAVPFDISAARALGADSVDHYGQVRERAVRALENCGTALAYAQRYGSQIAQGQAEELTLKNESDRLEAEYDKELIALYGRPFAGDIGVGKTYEQGYEGPDLYHYNYMDLSEYGLSGVASATVVVTSCKVEYQDADGNWTVTADASWPKNDDGTPMDVPVRTNVVGTLTFSLTADGFVVKPAAITGTRAAEGSIQAAYRSFLTAYVKMLNAETVYNDRSEAFGWTCNMANTAIQGDFAGIADMLDLVNENRRLVIAGAAVDAAQKVYEWATQEAEEGMDLAMKVTGDNMVVGTANTIPNGTITKSTVFAITQPIAAVMSGLSLAAELTKSGLETTKSVNEIDMQLAEIAGGMDATLETRFTQVRTAAAELLAAANEYRAAQAEVLAQQQAYRTLVQKGQTLQEERKLARAQIASKVTDARYRDMYARIERNNALSKYSTTFDTAQKYVFELAKVYDYETGLLSGDKQAGDTFLGEIIGTRALGAPDAVTDSSVADDGLWGIVNRMDANWEILSGRLGVKNPDTDSKWHSLRYSCFRIARDAAADGNWTKELSKHWVDDIFADTRVRRHCQTFASDTAPKAGLVIPFKTSIREGENFFGHMLMGGEEQYSASAYSTRIFGAGVKLVGYESLTKAADGLSANPQVYLVPTGLDCMYAPSGTTRTEIGFNVVDQVLPLPYKIGSTMLDDVNWLSTFSGLDGSVDSFATIRKHAQFPANGSILSTLRLVGRSAWNEHWILVIPESAMTGVAGRGRELFLSGAVTDIEIGFLTYTRQGN